MNSTDRLTRAQVDLAVRHLTGRFYDEHGAGDDADDEQFKDFARKLAWQISGDNTPNFRAHLLEMLQAFRNFDGIGMGDLPLSMLRDCESDLNESTTKAIGAAGLPGGYINRYVGKQPANYPVHAARFNAMAQAGRVNR
ncbi:hypothetical protein KKR91_01305 [Arthrobacter jiangjiafuii]|uniref:Uncharacterized protein n=1 Tax=Arthrobacter jiangjiafuii TaxID=2817475 RepID=A0A975M5H2_9MICC|nr:hypothetical protein [Arthrobacter jiangjiafuii]MBP3044855.1 hypothetical protein [Arthrobacter jiangjiafuii]QWC10321.1 hypothetical protein KKR91_01305 [Arthrobacter jiangjiafuii]